MKNLMFIFRLLTFIVVLLPISFSEAAAADAVVRVIYLHPNDGAADLSKYDALRQYVKDVHQFFADEMERHGHGRKTFELETDTTGEIVVHRVTGKHTGAYYSRFTGHKAWEEIRDHFGFGELHHIYLIAVDLPDASPPWEGKHCGEAGVNFSDSNGIPRRRYYDRVTLGEEILGGFAVIPAAGHCLSPTLIAHELGHAFGLAHDFREGRHSNYVMAYGFKERLSICAAEWLSVSRFFTKHPSVENPPGKIQMISAPAYSQEGIRFRFELADADGLHQAKLLLSEPSGEILSDCKQLQGETQTVDFFSPELARGESFDTIMLQMIDAAGNITWSTLRIDIAGLLPPPKVVEIPDPNLATALRNALALDSNARITDRQLLSLRSLDASSRAIKHLTGLEHATQLTRIYFNGNQISDLTPLSLLTKLRVLGLDGNHIRNVEPLTELTRLEFLFIGGNQITDTGIKHLSNLTGLRVLALHRNQIQNIKPLAHLKNLRELHLSANEIRDVSPLVTLTHLQVLYLQGNPIKNRDPLLALLRRHPEIKIYLTEGGEPLPVTLSYFRAEMTDTGVVLRWITESELNNAGFNIYRSETKNGEFKVVNPTMIQGAGTTSERHTYTWKDTTAKPNVVYYYRIEDISYAGVSKQLSTVRLRGLISASGKLTLSWADLKKQN